MKGLVNVIKPPNMTSHDVVGYLRRLFHEKRIGHSGTLDPMAVGVLNIYIGSATKLIPYHHSPYKKYRAEMLLGKTSDTLDIWGEVQDVDSEIDVNSSDIEEVLESFLGNSEQVPPMYSAIKKDGKKLYELARKGIEIKRESRTIDIKHIELFEIINNRIIFDIICSRGTYIRSLVDDIGNVLKTSAIMTNLIRLENEYFLIEEAFTLEEIERMYLDNNFIFLIPMRDILKDVDEYELSKSEYKKFSTGIPIDIRSEKSLLKIIYDNRLVGIGIYENMKFEIKKRFLSED
ncbi:MAG: tRNA pseudouridine(55) synthase TruB [Bacillota bacterium]|nr:tRNA pseudouridine(55) synthase TruB [Bacillota bacterium]